MESLLDASPRRMKSKRLWIKPLWYRVSYFLQKNALLLSVAVIMFLGTLIFIKSTTTRSPTLIKNNTLIEPHQARLMPAYPPADTSLTWPNGTSHPVKAGFVVLAQESDLFRLRATMMDVENHFNHAKNYPWIIISDKPFSSRFRYWIENTSKAPVVFGQAPAVEWQEPYWVDIKKAETNMKELLKQSSQDKAESMSWRRMTRYNMGFLAHHPLLKDLEYYWKVQPGSQYHCDVPQDPFVSMKKKGQKLSFTLTALEKPENLGDFYQTAQRFIDAHRQLVQPVSDSMFKGLLTSESRHQEPTDYVGEFTSCMIYNNFAIYSLEYLRSKEYQKFFEALDTTGGFFYNKWGDALPQTMAAALLLKKSEISFGDVDGYNYGIGASCPNDLEQYTNLKCTCKQADYRVANMRFCTPQMLQAII